MSLSPALVLDREVVRPSWINFSIFLSDVVDHCACRAAFEFAPKIFDRPGMTDRVRFHAPIA